ncbi:MAG: HD-like signal output (HDOD) protein/prolyl-tRNA editing enzyme YbaK/EbsC (Cys-tRNA(Pro) deacylase) [Pseudohongiellaceae bacterium]|jgi:HD-like signal output (HDOD) protein/prolyl-tRNA editing enzyme YbaK/EbsC (Cys-tRNA(Pro) deacylase)
MGVPAATEKVLQQNNTPYVLVETVNPNHQALTLRSTILQDGNGKVQVISPEDSLLDIDHLNAEISRKLSSSSIAEVQELCKKHDLDTCPVVPGVLPLYTIIDEAVLKATEVQMATGHNKQTICVRLEDFKKLCENVTYMSVTIGFDKLQTANLDDAKDVEDITSAVANFTQLRIKQRLEETLEFPPLPSTAQRIIKLRVNTSADIQDLTDIVEADPSLAAQVVSWASSPYYAAPGKIKSVHDAIVRVLGFDLVLNLSLGLSLGKTLSMPKDSARGFSPYWEQAAYTATAVEALVGVISPKERPAMGVTYLSGLLHNFGHLILAEVFPPQFSNICRLQEANPYSNHSYIERHVLGVTREQLGSWLLRLWNMPEEVCNAVRFQNESCYKDEDYIYANLLFVAERLLRKHRIGDAPLEDIPAEMFERLNLDPEKAEEAISHLLESTAELNIMVSNMSGN